MKLKQSNIIFADHNHQRDGLHQHEIHKGQASYQPNTIDNNWPVETPPAAQNGGFLSYHERIDGHKIRQRSESFSDHFSQARLYYRSLAPHEQKHVVDAYTFELSKVQRPHIREREVKDILANIDLDLAQKVGQNLGIEVPQHKVNFKHNSIEKSEKLSMQAFIPQNIEGRKIAVLIHDNVNAAALKTITHWTSQEKAIVHFLTPSLAPVKGLKGEMIKSDGMQKAEPSIVYDAVVIVDGDNLDTVMTDGITKHYLLEAYKHLKPIVLLGDKVELLEQLHLTPDEGMLLEDDFLKVVEKFKVILRHQRVWSREAVIDSIPA